MYVLALIFVTIDAWLRKLVKEPLFWILVTVLVLLWGSLYTKHVESTQNAPTITYLTNPSTIYIQITDESDNLIGLVHLEDKEPTTILLQTPYRVFKEKTLHTFESKSKVITVTEIAGVVLGRFYLRDTPTVLVVEKR